MAQKEKVCRNCRRFVSGTSCPVCNQSNFSRSWKGVVVITDPSNSEIAQVMGVTMHGKYCVWVK